MRFGAIVAGVLSLLALSGVTAGASEDPYHDQAERIGCPAAPPGWFNPAESAGGKTILTPLTTVAEPAHPTTFFGAPVVEVDCHYLTTAGKNLEVIVRYALPIDLNPWNDFYIGCTVTGHPQNAATGAHAWNDHDRTYRVVGTNTWSLATFIDDLGAVGAADVPRFEAITRQMLAAAQPFAHNCKLAGGGNPVDIKSIWTFSFDARTSSGGVTSSGKTSGSFVTTPDTSGGPVGAITNLFADDFRLMGKGHGTTFSLELHVAAPIDFHHRYGSTLRAHVLVLASSEAGCRKGAAGTLVLSVEYLSAPQVAVKVCGHTYLAGKGQVSAQMKTV